MLHIRKSFDRRKVINMADPAYFNHPRTNNNTIIGAYRNDGSLSKNTRCLLTRLVIAQEKDRQFRDVFRQEGITYLRQFKMTSAKFTTWATQIAEVFIGESFFVYCTPFRMENGIKIDPTGFLYEHYHYTKKKLRKNHLLQQVAPQRNAPVAAPEVPG
ncbi:uncharacterized protein LOC135171049 [Diachasmimorpha longicaudata]|uniref:uncharacterized protein LOC135171049 n=1 Tax=Diachasmimorpha longicaudata TaxID=58733 RepID=UPI0030B88432